MSSNRMPRSFNATPKPFNFQSTQQSPSFMKAVKPPTGASTKNGKNLFSFYGSFFISYFGIYFFLLGAVRRNVIFTSQV